MQQRFLLQILLLAWHVSGTTVPIIRSSGVLYGGCCLWYLVLWFSSCCSCVELRVMCLVCRMLPACARYVSAHAYWVDEHTERGVSLLLLSSYSSYIKTSANCALGNKECVHDGGKETSWKQAVQIWQMGEAWLYCSDGDWIKQSSGSLLWWHQWT